MIKHNLSYGFPQSWITSSLEYKYVNSLYRKFFGNEEDSIIVNLTWGGSSAIPNDHRSKYEQVDDIVKNKNPKHALFFNFVDDYDVQWTPIIDRTKLLLGNENVKIVGCTPFSNDFNMQFWPLAVYNFFTQYEAQHLLPKKFKNSYLCYNRKPHNHRVELFNSFKTHRLLDKGIFTLGSENIKEAKTFKDNGFSGNQDAFKIFADDTGIPNDLMSLGTLEYWRESFLVIVTETTISNSRYPFLTEKTFKPIIGLRPFLVLGPDHTIPWLEENGFKTFNIDFGCDNITNITQIAKAVRNLNNVNLKKLYKSLRPKIEHNKHRFFEFCKEQENLIYN